MAKISGNEVRPGTMIEHQGRLWMAVKSQSVKPGKGGAYNQVELKDIESGTKLNERFRSSEMVEEIHLDKKDFQFLYASGDMLTFMDMENYEQIELAVDFVGEDQAQFLQDGMKTLVQLHEGKPIGIKLPVQVTLTIAEADPNCDPPARIIKLRRRVRRDSLVACPPLCCIIRLAVSSVTTLNLQANGVSVDDGFEDRLEIIAALTSVSPVGAARRPSFGAGIQSESSQRRPKF